MRVAAQMYERGLYDGLLHVYSHGRALGCLQTICELLLPKKHCLIGSQAIFHELSDGDEITVDDLRLTAFDIHSTKEKQFGFRARLPSGRSLVCLGDEPFCEQNRHIVENADWLLSEAFCLYADRDLFRPYEKHHTTTLEAAKTAQRLGARNIVLYHTEDTSLARRKADYTREAQAGFSGNVFVPDDLERIDFGEEHL